MNTDRTISHSRWMRGTRDSGRRRRDATTTEDEDLDLEQGLSEETKERLRKVEEEYHNDKIAYHQSRLDSLRSSDVNGSSQDSEVLAAGVDWDTLYVAQKEANLKRKIESRDATINTLLAELSDLREAKLDVEQKVVFQDWEGRMKDRMIHNLNRGIRMHESVDVRVKGGLADRENAGEVAPWELVVMDQLQKPWYEQLVRKDGKIGELEEMMRMMDAAGAKEKGEK